MHINKTYHIHLTICNVYVYIIYIFFLFLKLFSKAMAKEVGGLPIVGNGGMG